MWSEGDNLRSVCRRTARRRGFSLAELVVALGVLVLMFSLAGQVFNTTIKSTGQAKALTGVSQLFRAFEQTIREDLRNVQPGSSLILIQGNPVNAYWTQDGKDADDDNDPSTGYPHLSDPTRENADGNMVAPRADMLMLLIPRSGRSVVEPEITARWQQVVYGHADLGEYLPAAAGVGGYAFNQNPLAYPVDSTTQYPSATELSPVPAEQWHLARRSILLVPVEMPDQASIPPGQTLNYPIAATDPDNDLGHEGFLLAEFDVFGNFDVQQLALAPGNNGPWYLAPGIQEIFDTSVPQNPIRRSRLDLTPPAPRAGRLAHYFLPRCASFKVEWALNPGSPFVDGRLDGTTEIYWIDPGNPGVYDPADPTIVHPLVTLTQAEADPQTSDAVRGNLRGLLDETGDWEDTLLVRFGGEEPGGFRASWRAPDGRPNMTVFRAWQRDSAGNPVPEDVFPGALRITIELFDRERRLERPMRHVMIVPIPPIGS